MTTWRIIGCPNCLGHGLVSDYGNGEDFYGAKECPDCFGRGSLSVSEKGTLAVYPGGPLRGKLSKDEMADARRS
jgi:hypothetical protein